MGCMCGGKGRGERIVTNRGGKKEGHEGLKFNFGDKVVMMRTTNVINERQVSKSKRRSGDESERVKKRRQ